MIQVQKVSKVYLQGKREIHALFDVSFGIKKGEFISIMGASGSGKSTLLNLIGGLDQPTAGKIFIDGSPLHGISDDELTLIRRKKVGFVFQFFNLLPMLTAKENIEMPLSIAGIRPDPAWMERLVGEVGLADRLSHRPAELSGGQQQRVAIARALVSKPAVIFADEPTGNLDSKTGGEILELLHRSVEELNQTIVMVTHDARAAAIADELLFLEDGRIVRRSHHMTSEEIFDLMKSLE